MFYDIKPRIATLLKAQERQISAQFVHLIWQTPRHVLYEYTFLVDQSLKSATVFIQKIAITDLSAATSLDAIFCCCYCGHRDSLESLSLAGYNS